MLSKACAVTNQIFFHMQEQKSALVAGMAVKLLSQHKRQVWQVTSGWIL
jgi:hypothetical protein